MPSRIFLILVLSLAATIACTPRERPPVTPLPTPTEIVFPATWTPTIPTATPEPPTNTPRPPTRTPNAETRKVVAALARTRGIAYYYARMDMTMTSPVTGFFGNKPNEPLAIMSLEGRVNNRDSHWTLTGLFMSFLTGDPGKGLEIISLGNNVYLRGPVPLLGAMQDRWYIAPRSLSTGMAESGDLQTMLDLFGNSKAELPALKPNGTQSLDKKACEVYRANEREAGAFFAAPGTLDSFSQVAGNDWRLSREHAGLGLWICEDGYLRKMDMQFEAQSLEDAADKATVRITFQLSDLNVIVPIPVPPDPLPLPLQNFSFPTALPRPTESPAD